MHWLIKWCYGAGMAVGPVLAYVYQYYLISQTKSVGSFSIKLCGVLLFSNIMKMGYYFFEQFSNALLFQTVFMFVVQTLLLRLCVNTMIKEGLFKRQNQQESSWISSLCRLDKFWKWDNIQSYFVATLILALAVLSAATFSSYWQLSLIGALIGYIGLIAESCLLIPQLLQNKKQGRVKGLSHLLIFINNTGDILQLTYYLIQKQPIPFILCGVIQLIVDVLIVCQIVYFKMWMVQLDEESNNQEKTFDGKKTEVGCQSDVVIAIEMKMEESSRGEGNQEMKKQIDLQIQ